MVEGATIILQQVLPARVHLEDVVVYGGAQDGEGPHRPVLLQRAEHPLVDALLLALREGTSFYLRRNMSF